MPKFVDIATLQLPADRLTRAERDELFNRSACMNDIPDPVPGVELPTSNRGRTGNRPNPHAERLAVCRSNEHGQPVCPVADLCLRQAVNPVRHEPLIAGGLVINEDGMPIVYGKGDTDQIERVKRLALDRSARPAGVSSLLHRRDELYRQACGKMHGETRRRAFGSEAAEAAEESA